MNVMFFHTKSSLKIIFKTRLNRITKHKISMDEKLGGQHTSNTREK